MIEIKGYWYLPLKPEEKYFGILHISNRVIIKLELFGYFEKKEINESLGFFPRRIFGLSDSGEKITLFRCLKIKGSVRDFSRYNADFKYCFRGDWMEDEEIMFSTLQVEVNDLFNWFSGEEMELFLQKKERHFLQRQLYNVDQFKITLKAANIERWASKTKSITISREAYFLIEFSNGVNIDEVVKILKSINYLFSLLGKKSNRVEKIRIPISKSLFYKFGELYIDDDMYREHNEVEHRNVITHTELVAKDIEKILSKYFSIYDQIHSIIELIVPVYYFPNMNRTVRFMNVISSYESWHRVFVKSDDEESITNYKSICDKVKNDKELLKWFKSKKIIFQSLSLPKRLDYLCQIDNGFLIQNCQEFKSIAAGTRNGIAHNLEKGKKYASDSEVQILSNIIQVLLEKMILNKIGVGENFINISHEKHPLVEELFNIKKAIGYDKF